MHTKELLNKINELQKQKEYIVIVIEGGSASGKTTLAKNLKETFNCTVLHMDDFFLRPEQRTKDRLAQPGGNVDRERFYEEVVIPLVKRDTIVYRPFDCATMSLQSARKIEPDKIIVVEGAYSTHPELGEYYDLSVFLDIAPELQQERIWKRNTPDKAERFFAQWIPMEQKYFEAMRVKERCDMILPVDEK